MGYAMDAPCECQAVKNILLFGFVETIRIEFSVVRPIVDARTLGDGTPLGTRLDDFDIQVRRGMGIDDMYKARDPLPCEISLVLLRNEDGLKEPFICCVLDAVFTLPLGCD
jgi:hypothetical protein